MINESYAPLYGYSQMTQGQINQYIKMYLPLIDLRMVSLVEDENENLVAVGISMPSLSEALQKAREQAGETGVILVSGSLSFLAEYLQLESGDENNGASR